MQKILLKFTFLFFFLLFIFISKALADTSGANTQNLSITQNSSSSALTRPLSDSEKLQFCAIFYPSFASRANSVIDILLGMTGKVDSIFNGAQKLLKNQNTNYDSFVSYIIVKHSQLITDLQSSKIAANLFYCDTGNRNVALMQFINSYKKATEDFNNYKTLVRQLLVNIDSDLYPSSSASSQINIQGKK